VVRLWVSWAVCWNTCCDFCLGCGAAVTLPVCGEVCALG